MSGNGTSNNGTSNNGTSNGGPSNNGATNNRLSDSRLSVWVWAIAAGQLLVLLATSARYGYHRDEMYFVVAGSHPAFGYPDQPPLVPLLCAAIHHLASGSLTALRVPSALAAAGTTLLGPLISREAGGSNRAQVIAAWCVAVSGIGLATGHFVTTTTFDLLSTTALCWLVIRAVVRHSGPALLWAGVVTGVGFEAKPQVAFVAVVMIIALAVTGPHWPLRSGWLVAGAGAALALAAPYLIWQTRHGWPQLTVAGNIGGSAEGGRAGFIPFQLLLVSPVLVPIWVAGLVAPWRSAVLAAMRFLPVTYLILAVAYIVGNGKAYYLASLYPALLGIGAIPVAAWLERGRRRLRTGLLATGIGLSAVVSALIALPLLPVTSLQGSFAMAVNPDQGETVGWPRFVDTVAAAWRAVPADQRAHTAIFTTNYGEAGAIDLLGKSRGLPRAHSGHNALALQGMPGPGATYALVVGYLDASDAAPNFTDCSELARVDNGVGLKNDEQGLPVLLCRPAASWAALWPRLRHYS